MKMFYTKEELKKLSEKEMADLMGFEGGDNYYFYSDLLRLGNEDGEYSFYFNDGITVYTQNKHTYESVKNGKIRYSLLMSSLEEIKKEERERDEFYKEVTSMVRNELKNVHDSVTTFRTNSDSAIIRMEKQNTEGIKNIGKISGDAHSRITKKVSDAAKKWDKQMEKLNTFDTKAYDIKMEKLDKLIDMFSSLMEE